MRIVDAQILIWAADTSARPWLQRHRPPRTEALTIDDTLREMNDADGDHAILIPVFWECDRNDVVLAISSAS